MIEENKDTVIVGLEKVPLKTEREEKKRKTKRIVKTIVACVLFLVIGFVGGIIYMYSIHPTNRADSANTFGEIEGILSRYWIYAKDYDDLQTELEDKAFYGMTKFDEDPFTTYMSAEELDEFATGINMDYVGIGVMYSMRNNKAVVERVFVNSPAEQAGMLPGDIIDEVDGVSVEGLDTSEIKNLVIGEAGTKVELSITRNNQKLKVTAIRNSVDNSVYCYTENDYIVMELSSFGSSTAKECMNYLDQFSDYSKIIVDLRGNTGGYQTSVKEIAGLFIGTGEVYLIQEDSNGNRFADLTECSKTYDFDSIVLLVNGETASAAEVFTICLKEQLDNVTVVGQTTYGKGVIQSTHYLINGGVLKFTSYNWYSPNGVSIQKTGIKPDIEVKLADIAYEQYIDMDENTTYEYDSVSNAVRICQMALDLLDYDVDRTDGYFDRNFGLVLKQYKADKGIEENEVLDQNTYNILMSDVVIGLSDKKNDTQFNKAIELLSN